MRSFAVFQKFERCPKSKDISVDLKQFMMGRLPSLCVLGQENYQEKAKIIIRN